MIYAASLTAALLLDALFGEPHWLWSRLPHPAVLMGRLLSACERALYRDGRAAGVLTLLICICAAVCAGLAVAALGPAVETLAAAILLAQRSLMDHVRRVSDDLRLSLPAARASVAMIVSRDTATLDPAQVSRAAIESAAENFSDGVIAPAFWFLLFGLPGLCLYKMVNTADSMIGYRTPRYDRFGWAAARLDDVLNWVPARASACLIWLAGGCMGAWADISKDANTHKSPNAGWPEAALSRALDIALAGPRPYHGALQDFPWVNARGLRNICAPQIDATLVLLWRTWSIAVIITLCLALI